MIVISGALVLVALVLLVIGLISPDLAFVYASIAVSLASFVFLVVGILQRRKEELPGAEEATTTSGTAATSTRTEELSTSSVEGVTTLPPAAVKVSGAKEPSAGSVLVVAGRPRYHVEGCRYLTGKDAESVKVADAREEGFTACGVCRPDDALAAQTAALPDTTAQEPAVSEPREDGSDDQADEAAASTPRAPRVSMAKPTAISEKAPATRASKAVPVTKAAKAAPAKPLKAAPAKAGPAKTAAKAPVKAAAKAVKAPASPAKKAAAAPVKRGGVIVIPDRGKYHTADCRYVRGAEETLQLTKAAATKQGYDACGVCNP